MFSLLSAACAGPAEPPPSVYDTPARAAALDDADGIDPSEPLLGGFVHGEATGYWIFDVGGASAMPVYRLCTEEGDSCVPLEHPPIVSALPDQEGYEPYGQLHWAHLPSGWSGQLTSVAEMQAELESQGMPEPESTSELWHCPIAGPSATLEVATDTTLVAETTVYGDGMSARCYDLSADKPNRAVFPSGSLFIRNVYVLTRDGEELPLVEGERMIDMNGDGDQHDSNNIFGVGVDDADYSPLWRMVTVTVPAGRASIDEGEPHYNDSDQLFETAPDYTITPLPDEVLEHVETDRLINCPLQSTPGAL